MQKSVLIAGGSGLIGKRLTELLLDNGYRVHILSRTARKSTDQIKYFVWNFDSMEIENDAVNVDHIINLTGAGIADKRWTKARKKILIESRVLAAQLIKKGLEERQHRPLSYVSASAIGIYGNRSDEKLYVDSPAGKGFMATCCIEWENAAKLLEHLVERHVILRVGIVLSTKGGALQKILMTYPILSYFGSGKQYYSWIHIDDVCRMFQEAIENEQFYGTYNAVSPEPLTNRTFIKKIKNAIGGFVMPAPAFGLKIGLGEMADVVLNSNRVYPKKLIEKSFSWTFPNVENAINDLKKRKI